MRRVAVAALVVAAVAIVGLPAGAAAEPTCTDTWTGGAGDGLWQSAGNWSTASVPSSSDVVCIGSGTTVQVTTGSDHAGVLQDSGSLTISGGSLELASSSTPSSVASLSMQGGALTGAGLLDVSSSLSWTKAATMSGTGSTVLQSGASGTIELVAGERAILEGRALVNEGTLTFATGTIAMSAGARIESSGTFKANSETTSYGSQIVVPSGSEGAAPSFVNTGTFEKTAGTGTTAIGVVFEQDGTVTAHTGHFSFAAGEVQQAPQGNWAGSVGAAGYVLAGWHGYSEDASYLPGVTMSLLQGGRFWWAQETSDTRALEGPAGSLRDAGTFYSESEVKVRLSFAASYSGDLHLYAVDWDTTARRESITVEDGSGSRTVPLDSSFHEGAWVSLPISVAAAGTVMITVDRLAGSNAVLSGIFLGDEGTPPGPTVASEPQGDWSGAVGSAGYLLPDWDGSQDVSNMLGVTPDLVQGSRYLWEPETSDARALEEPGGSSLRNASTFYDPNEILLRLNFSKAYTGDLHLYAVDWNTTERRELITVDGQTAALAGDFHGGAWVSFPISVTAAGTVTITVDRLAGANAVLSGIFLGDAGAPPTMPVVSAPKGDWVGDFGTEGYDLFAWNESTDLASLPDESVSLAQGSRYRWMSSTTETQALENPEGTTRRAATLYDSNQLKLQLEFTAAYTGDLNLYAVDWDSGGRRELITVDGQTADLSSDFSAGAWVSFPISVAAGGVVPITVDRLAGSNAVLSGIFLGTAVPPANTVVPAISGTVQDGHTLSASTGAWEGTEPFNYSYQWESCDESGEECSDIEGATGSNYVPGPGDIGNALRVVVTASNAVGAASATSAASAVVSSPVTLPVSSAPPEISGATQQGQTLRASTGAWIGAPPLTYGYQWERCNASGESCADIEGATDPTYELGAGDVGSTLLVAVRASNTAGHASDISRASGTIEAPSSGAEPVCTDTWVGGSYESWEIPWDWSSGILPGPSDVACIGPETTIEIPEGATNQVGVVRDEGELFIWHASFELTDAVHASTVSTLIMPNGFGGGGTLTGAGTLYVSSHLELEGGVMSGSGQTILEPAATGTLKGVSLTGRALVNEGTLTLGEGGSLGMADGSLLENRGTFIANSQACCTSQIRAFVEGGGGAPRIVNTGIMEKTERSGTTTVAVPFTNDGMVRALKGTLALAEGGVPDEAATGAWSAESGASIAFSSGAFKVGEAVNLTAVHVEAGVTVTRVPAPANTTPPSISGSPAEGHTLTASGGDWSGQEPISLSYQWQRCNDAGEGCVDISGATGSTYLVSSDDGGSTLRAMVTATNADGFALAGSAASETVSGNPPSNTTSPSITGTVQDGQTLTVDAGAWSGSSPIAYAYQWESCDTGGSACAPIENATGPTHELTDGDIGSTLRAIVTATNADGSTEATSAASAVAQAEPPSELEAPSIWGAPDVYEVLHANTGVWTGTETQLSYQWESCNESGGECGPVEGATGPEYDLTEGDLSRTLRVRVGVHGARDSLSDVSPVTPVIGETGALAGTQPPSISGSPQSGQALTAEPEGWSGGFGAIGYTYQWQGCDSSGSSCEDISGATTASYVPVTADVGRRLRVLVTASDEESHTRSEASRVTQPVAGTSAPVAEQAPVVSGAALDGQTLTAGTGVFSGENPTSYSYQWERCAAGGSCEAIEGATHSSYTLLESDVSSTLLVLVSVGDSGGSTTAVAAPTATVGPEPLLELSAPSISGVVQAGGALQADPGLWTASGSVTYAYQWETCDSSGADCTAIEGATEPTYDVVSGDLGSTLRVTVTAKSPLGSKSATSAHTAVASGGEVSVEEAATSANRTDPALLAGSTTATLEGQSVAPALTDTGEELASTGTLTSSTISKETAGEFAVNSPVSELSLTPVESAPTATTPPTIVNGAAALFANTWPATDTVIRPQPLGVAAILQLRSAEAPHSFSWEVRLGPDQELKQLSDGSVAVVEAPEEAPEPSGGQESEAGGTLPDTSEGPSETSEEKSEAEEEEAEPQTEEEVPLESLPTAPHREISSGEAGTGQPEPQQTQAAYEAATSAMTSAEAQTADKALMVITPPTVTDAEGHSVPASLRIADNTFTMTIKPDVGAGYPLLTDLKFMASSDKKSATHNSVHYGLSDPLPEQGGHIGPGHIDEHIAESGKPAPGFDPNLKNGPLHIHTARLVVPYDVFSKPYMAGEKNRLEAWLKRVGKEHLRPFITLYKDQVADPCQKNEETTKKQKEEVRCPLPSIKVYEKNVERLMENLIAGDKKRGIPPVELWGAWNEPDLNESPLRYPHAARAAKFWEVAHSILTPLAKQHRCGHCNVVAGEFAFGSGYELRYTSIYRNTLLCHPNSDHHCTNRHWSGLPAVWGFHDYHDVVEREKGVAEKFTKFTHDRLGDPRVFMTEAGVEMQSGHAEVLVRDGTEEVPLKGRFDLQAQAAEEFRNLYVGLPRIDREYYYMYTAPTEREIKNHSFDSALLQDENEQLNIRPAYCVLAYEHHVCPPTVTAQSSSGLVANCGELPTTIGVRGSTMPNGGRTVTYHFEYGPTSTYGHSTTPKTVPGGWGSLNVEEAVPDTVKTLDQGCVAQVHFRLVATNAQGSRHSTDQTAMLNTINGS